MRMPGPAFSSTIPDEGPSGCEMSGVIRSTPQMSRPTTRAARSQTRHTSGCTRSVTSSAVPPVDRFALSRSQTVRPSSGTDSGSRPCVPQMHESGVVEPYGRQRLLVAFAAPRILVGNRHELAHGTRAVAGDRWRLAPARRDHAAADDENAVVIAHQHLLDDDARGLCLRALEGRPHLVARAHAHGDAFPLIAVERLDHDRRADLVVGRKGLLFGLAPLRPRAPG